MEGKRLNINVLSLFHGISAGQLALQKAGINVNKYFASEIDKYAIKVTQKHFPDTIQLGDVKNINLSELPKIHLLIGGSPCQGFSRAGKKLNFKDPRSNLFWEYLKILKIIKPKYFFLENVRMTKDCEQTINDSLGIEGIHLNSSLVSAQNRERIYWTNIPSIKIPEDRNINLIDILEKKSPYIKKSKKGRIKKKQNKASCLTAGGKSGGNHSDMDIIHQDGESRRYSLIEYERLQTLPDNFTDILSPTQRRKCVANSWTIEIIVLFFLSLKKHELRHLINLKNLIQNKLPGKTCS